MLGKGPTVLVLWVDGEAGRLGRPWAAGAKARGA